LYNDFLKKSSLVCCESKQTFVSLIIGCFEELKFRVLEQLLIEYLVKGAVAACCQACLG